MYGSCRYRGCSLSQLYWTFFRLGLFIRWSFLFSLSFVLDRIFLPPQPLLGQCQSFGWSLHSLFFFSCQYFFFGPVDLSLVSGQGIMALFVAGPWSNHTVWKVVPGVQSAFFRVMSFPSLPPFLVGSVGQALAIVFCPFFLSLFFFFSLIFFSFFSLFFLFVLWSSWSSFFPLC